MARIIEKFSRTLAIALKELTESNFKHLLEVSETARRDSLDVMLQLCQRLHTSAPIRNMKKAEDRQSSKNTESKVSMHSCDSSSPHPYQVHIYSYTGDNLRDLLDQIPKANPNITLSGPSPVVSHTIGNTPLLVTQTAYTQGSCQCGHSITTPAYASFHDDHQTPDSSSPLKKRLDEMDRIFSSPIRNSVAAQPPSTRPTTYPPPSAQSFVSNQFPKVPLDAPSQQWHSWSPAPSIVSSTLPASTRSSLQSSTSDFVYSQTKTKSLQENLNAITQTMIPTKLGSMYTPSFSPLPSVHSGLLLAPTRTTSHLPQAPLLTMKDCRDQISQWAESVQADSLASGPGSVSGASSTASLAFPGVRRYAGSVRMTGGLPTPPP
jgi:hypothetical protein